MNKPTFSSAWNVALWIAQVLLAAMLLYGGLCKLFLPLADLSAMWPWTGELPLVMVRFTAVIDLLGAAGLLLPALLRKAIFLVPLSAVAVILLMVAAFVFHWLRGEASDTGINLIAALMAVFIAWGRWRKAPFEMP